MYYFIKLIKGVFILIYLITVLILLVISFVIVIYLKIAHTHSHSKNYKKHNYESDNNNQSNNTQNSHNDKNHSEDTHKLKNIRHIANSLNYKSYQVRATYIATNRKRTIYIDCHKNEILEKLLEDKGFKPPYEIEELPPDSPSEKQLEFANNVVENLPPNLNIHDISCLLNRYQQDDPYPPNPELIAFADERKFKFSYYIGKKGLYNLIFYQLELRDKIAFFVFSIYRHLSDDRHANLDTSPLKDYFYNFAEQYINDESFVKSMLKYEGEDLRFFGTLTINTKEYTGGSINTKAYKIASEYLHNVFNTPLTKNKTLH